MREIKFRGVTHEFSSPRWVYGDLICNSTDAPRIMDDYHYGDEATTWLVDPATVGQFTGLKDEDGREIYEGDVIRSDLLPHMRTTVCNGCVEYRNGAFYVEYIDHTYANLGDLIFYSGTSSTVIGNIYDNPELLEAKNARD